MVLDNTAGPDLIGSNVSSDNRRKVNRSVRLTFTKMCVLPSNPQKLEPEQISLGRSGGGGGGSGGILPQAMRKVSDSVPKFARNASN